jgi:hypothetical protein
MGTSEEWIPLAGPGEEEPRETEHEYFEWVKLAKSMAV